MPNKTDLKLSDKIQAEIFGILCKDLRLKDHANLLTNKQVDVPCYEEKSLVIWKSHNKCFLFYMESSKNTRYCFSNTSNFTENILNLGKSNG